MDRRAAWRVVRLTGEWGRANGRGLCVWGVRQTSEKKGRRGQVPASLANLKYSGEDSGHGVYRITVGQAETRELADRIMAVLEGDADIIKPADAAACSVLAVLLRRLQQADQYLDAEGIVGPKGEVRPLLPVVVSMANTSLRYLEALGATPQARAKLGVNTGRALDLARLMAQADEAGTIEEGGDTNERDTGQMEK